MYPRQISDEQLSAIWDAVEQNSMLPNLDRTVDENGDEFTIFGSWDEVETLGELIYVTLPQEVIDDYAPTWGHLPEDRKPNIYHHIEWAIGDYGFDDQFSTCSQCYSAIDIYDYQPMHGHNYDLGELYCRNCLKSNKGDSAEMYLQYCASHLEDEGEILRHVIDPSEYGYICLNPYTAYGEYRYPEFFNKYDGIENFPLVDHADLPYTLGYAHTEDLQRLAKAARLIDDNLRIIAQYGPGWHSHLLWAKFEEPIQDDPATNLIILQYAISRMFAKYKTLSQSKKG